ncbi:MAG: DUF3341 domain-containing protein [Chitinophagales bacterium]|nr:DUF3341 domain-containing protein [Chitinophagales bacterium]
MKQYLLALYDDEQVLLNAVDKVKGNGIKIHDVVTPFAVHGLEQKLGLRESRLHIGGFFVGMTGTTIALSFMTWVFTVNWPLVFGGKPHFSFPAFIPIIFEFTVLSASISMFLAFLVLCHLYPGRFREPLDPRTTSHLFGIVFRITEQTSEEEKGRMYQLLQESGAVEMKLREMNKHY